LLNELSGINIHRIQEPSLSLGEQNIKRNRALPRAAHSRENDELVARDGKRYVLEIMLASALNLNPFSETGFIVLQFTHSRKYGVDFQLGKGCFPLDNATAQLNNLAVGFAAPT
jgi:hypothetical protein